MKKIILIAFIVCSMTTIQAQEVKHDEVKSSQINRSKNKQIVFKVSGNCGMCKRESKKQLIQLKV